MWTLWECSAQRRTINHRNYFKGLDQKWLFFKRRIVSTSQYKQRKCSKNQPANDHNRSFISSILDRIERQPFGTASANLVDLTHVIKAMLSNPQVICHHSHGCFNRTVGTSLEQKIGVWRTKDCSNGAIVFVCGQHLSYFIPIVWSIWCLHNRARGLDQRSDAGLGCLENLQICHRKRKWG